MAAAHGRFRDGADRDRAVAGHSMIWRLFRRDDARSRTITTLHTRVNDASRAPGLYTGLKVPDTVEGRFECLTLHVILTLRRLETLPEPAADVAQDLVNSVFLQLDSSLRELGVGDFGVPKRMKKLGAAFYGRAETYGAALAGNDEAALALALARNVMGVAEGEEAAGLARYVMASAAALQASSLDDLLGDGPRFPDPGAFAEMGGAR